MTEMRFKQRQLVSVMVLSVLIFNQAAGAATGSFTVNISGTIAENTCTVNSDQPITVEFGTVLVNELANANASVPVTIACDSTPSGTVSMEIKGTASTFSSQALATDVNGLGIVLGSSGNTQYGVLDLNTFYDVSSAFGLTSKAGTFNLTATLMSDGTTALAGGEFNASATLVLQMS